MQLAVGLHRYGFNGQEKDDEVSGVSWTSYTAEFWRYDTRLCRRWNIDPMFIAKPWMSSYHAFSNNPILNVVPNGANDDEYTVNIETGETTRISGAGGDKTDYFHYFNGSTTDENGLLSKQNLIGGAEVDKASGNVDYWLDKDAAAKGYSMNSTESDLPWSSSAEEWQKIAKEYHELGEFVENSVNNAVDVGMFAMTLGAEGFVISATTKALLRGTAEEIAIETSIQAAKTSASLVKSGLVFSRHAALRMTERGITKKMVEKALSKGIKYYDPKNKTFNYVLENGFASGKDLLVGINPLTGEVATILRGNNLIISRFIPQ